MASSNGGAVYLDGCPSATFDRCRFEECYGNITGGGWIGASSHGIVIRDCRFATNRASSQGAALWLVSSDFTIERTEFEHNYIEGAPSTVIPTRGGAGYSQQSMGVVTDCSFKNERATGKGGAWFQIGGDVTFVGTRFEGNDAGIFGGAVDIELGGHVGLDHCLLVGNRAKFGGAIAASFTGAVTLEYCTMTLGTGRSAGGGIYVAGRPVRMTNDRVLLGVGRDRVLRRRRGHSGPLRRLERRRHERARGVGRGLRGSDRRKRKHQAGT